MILEGRDTHHKRLGNRGEALALDYIGKLGYTVVERNYRIPQGEIDIICYDKTGNDSAEEILVFIEVKTRSNLDYGYPLESLSEQKMMRVRRAAEVYMLSHGLEEAHCRFDVIGILLKSEGPIIEHEKDVMDY